jgi:hypothetical protein
MKCSVSEWGLQTKGNIQTHQKLTTMFCS